FLFQAEDGIRDWSVTGVQTCALPICAYQVAYQVLGDREAAQDAAQEAAITAWQRRGQLRGPSLRSWFLKITLNKARAIRRRRWFTVIRSTSLAERGRDLAGDALAGRPAPLAP